MLSVCLVVGKVPDAVGKYGAVVSSNAYASQIGIACRHTYCPIVATVRFTTIRFLFIITVLRRRALCEPLALLVTSTRVRPKVCTDK